MVVEKINEKKSMKKSYLSPEVEVCVVAVEQGFAVSSNLENPDLGNEQEW